MTHRGDPPAPSLRDALAARIRRHGPIPFGDYVEAALYDPTFGFFMRGSGAGRRRDFLTSPEVGPLFGAVIARALDEWWDELGRPDPFTFVDCGAGQGTLARAVVRAAPRCRDALELVLVERSPELRAHHPVGRGVQSRADLPDPPLVGVVFANELLDNLPFDLRQREGDEWREVMVDVDDRDALIDRPRADHGRVADQHAAVAWLRDALALVTRGRVVVIDYATTTDEMCRRPWREWLRTYRGHERGGDPLDAPGLQDITVDVALDQLSAVREPTSVESQVDFLRRHGIDALVEDGLRVWRERAHLGDLVAMEGRSRAGERDALCDPSGLGGFRVIEWRIG
jgi:SAM-dependent MidA family methyltransferase